MILQRIHPTPWKVVNELRRYAMIPIMRMHFALNGVRWGRGWRVYGNPIIQRHRNSEITIGDGLHMRNWRTSNPLGVVKPSVLCTWYEGAHIRIGANVAMTGTTVVAQEGVSIGDNVRIGANSTIIDTDFHPIAATERLANPRDGVARPIVIEQDCFIGMWAIILKGTHIGAGTVIGAGAVVSGTIPPKSVVVGNPGQIVRTEADDERG